MGVTSVEFERVFSAAHRIWNDESNCRRIHGHNYRVRVSIVAADGCLLDEHGFVVPWGDVKERIDRLDHRLILDESDPLVDALRAAGNLMPSDVGPILDAVLVPYPPSTENLAQWLADAILDAMRDEGYPVVIVQLRETDSIMATATSRRP